MSIVEDLQRWLDSALDSPTERGGAVAVVAEDDLACAAAGVADASSALPVRAETAFPVACLAKPVLATLVGALVEAGRLALDSPVHALLPGSFEGWSRISRSIRVHHLLTHSSGLSGAMDFEDRALSLAESAASRAFVAIAAAGDVYSYSSFGFAVLVEVIEAAAEADWCEALRRYLGEPLRIRFQCGQSAQTAVGHTWDAASRRLMPRGPPSPGQAARLHAAALDLQMTAGGLARLARLHLDGGTAPDGRRLVHPALCARLSADTLAPRCGSTPMLGLAWKRFAADLCGHRGLTDGSQASLLLCRRRRKALVCLANSGASTISQRFREAQGFPRLVSEHRPVCEHPGDTLGGGASVAGRYRAADRFARVSCGNGAPGSAVAIRFCRLDGTPFADTDIALTRIGSTAYYVGKPRSARLPKGLLVEFIADAAGRIGWARVNGKALRKYPRRAGWAPRQR